MFFRLSFAAKLTVLVHISAGAAILNAQTASPADRATLYPASSLASSLPGQNGVPSIDWRHSGHNEMLTAGPLVSASVNGKGGRNSVFLGNGASFLRQVDFSLPLNGIDWFHERLYSSANTTAPNWQGEKWWSNEMMFIDVAGTEGESNVSFTMDPHWTFNFTYSAGSWTCDDNYLLTLTFDGDSDEYIITRPDGYKWVFHDSAATDAEKLKRIEDPFGNDWAFTYSSGQLTDIVVDVVAGTDHKITYTYFTSGDNTGLLQYLKVYKSTTTTSANLIGQVEYVYHDSTSDGGEEFGSEDDLMKVIVSRKGTTDGDGTLSISESYFYRYYEGTWDTSTNPGTDHQLRYALNPENADRLNTAEGDPLTQTNANFASYANVAYEYNNGTTVRQTDERLPGSTCGCGGGGSASTTTYTWSTNGGSPTFDEWNIHCVADRDDDTRVIFDVTTEYQILTWTIQSEDDGTPTYEVTWHFDYGTSGATENRLTGIHYPSNCTAYDESSPYSVTLSSSAGVVYALDYDFATDTYDGYVEKIQIKEGTSGTANTLIAFGRTESTRPDLATSVIAYESGSEGDGRTTSFTYTFYDSGGDKVQLKQLDVTHPSVSAAKNGPAASAVEKYFYDKRTGALRWTLDGEGYVNFYAYEDETGVQDLTVLDANTSTLLTAIDDNWDGTTHADLGADDTVPFSRSGAGTALDIDSSRTIDWLGRVRKSTDAEGTINYFVHKDDETRVYPAWNTTTFVTLLPIRVTLTDKEGRPEDVISLKTSVTPTKDGSNEPTGAESYTNSDKASWTVTAYDLSGQVTTTDRYHNMPASGSGARYTDFYRTTIEYDSMGRRQYLIEDVSDESTYDREQVTKFTYDFLGRQIKVEEGVSDNTHDIGAGKPSLNTTVEYFFDDDADATPEQGEGDGNLSWVRRWFGTSAGQHNDTNFRYDARNRRWLTVPPTAPYTMVLYDNLDRVTTTGVYSATTNLDAGDDPAATENGNRLDLSKTHFDEMGRVYRTEHFDDPGVASPVNELASNTYYDRRSLVWATDAPNTGVRFTKFDGAGRRTQSLEGTQFDTAKFTSNAPDYPDDDEGLVMITDFTLDEVGSIQKVITKELNHNDADGIDLTNNDDYIRTYVYNWHDDAHRLTDTVNYGTNSSDGWKDNSTAPTYGASAPSRSDTVLVTTYAYDSEGRRTTVTDPKAIATLSVFDKLGRVTSKEEADGTGDERITNYAYNAQGSLTKITADLTTDQVTEYEYENAQNSRWVSKIKYPATDTDNGKSLGQPSDETYDRITFTYNVDGTLATRTDQNGTVLTWSYDSLRRKTEEEVTTVGSYTGGAAAVDSAVRALTWVYDSEGHVTHVTSHTDTTPDTSTWTDAANQIEYTYNAADRVTKEEQEVDGAVDGSTLAVDYGFGTDYSTGNYNRLNYVEYPDGRKVWMGYTHSGGAGTYQDTINDKFSRAGQIARDSSGSIGDLLAEYDFNGMGRMVRRNHDEATGAYGNDTRVDLWHGTSGDYDGFDRFGRIVDMKFTEFSGTAADFERRGYGYDRNSNRTHIEHNQYSGESQSFAYDNLNRLTDYDRGFLDTGKSVYRSSAYMDYGMDLLGNFTSGAGGLKINSASSVITHAVNETNEITSLDVPNPAGGRAVMDDDFASAIAGLWGHQLGTWSVSSGQVNVDALSSGEAILLATNDFDVDNAQVDISFPASTSTNKAGYVFNHDGSNTYHAVVLDRNAGTLALHKITSGSWSGALASTGVTIADNTRYTVKIERFQRFIRAVKTDESASISYTFSADVSPGSIGLYSDAANVKFDNVKLYQPARSAQQVPRFSGLADASISAGTLLVNGSTRGGLAHLDQFTRADYLMQTDVDLNGGANAHVYFRVQDMNNLYRVVLTSGGAVVLQKMVNGSPSSIGTGQTWTPSTATVKVKCSGTTLTVWVAGTQKYSLTDSSIAAGGVALGGESAKFDNLKGGIDNNGDDDVDDVGDDVIVNETFASTSTTASSDHAGNLIADGTFVYIYDAWNRLVKVRASNDSDIVIQTAEFDAIGRRMKKVVTNSGDLDGTTVYLYDGHKIIETRDGSSNVVQQFIHGTQYIDELVMVRAKDKGDLYIHQDANWNVVALTDLGGNLVERYVYEPYGQFTVHQVTSFGDRDGDLDVDATDKGTPGTTCTGTVSGSCRILDLDFDGDYDASDGTLFDALDAGIARHPARTFTGVSQPFAHQGLLFEPEIGSYQNRARQYDPQKRRFSQRDPMHLSTVLGELDNEVESINSFASLRLTYVSLDSNPVIHLDPTGYCIGSDCTKRVRWRSCVVDDWRVLGTCSVEVNDSVVQRWFKKKMKCGLKSVSGGHCGGACVCHQVEEAYIVEGPKKKMHKRGTVLHTQCKIEFWATVWEKVWVKPSTCDIKW